MCHLAEWYLVISFKLHYDYRDALRLGQVVPSYFFPDLGMYEVRVNASNTVSYGIGSLKVEIIERTNNVTVDKLAPPPGAVAVGDTLQLQVSHVMRTYSSIIMISFVWKIGVWLKKKQKHLNVKKF